MAWEEVYTLLNFKTIHPLKDDLMMYLNRVSDEVDAILRKIPGDIAIYRIDIPWFLVHIGAVEAAADILRLPDHDCHMEEIRNLQRIQEGSVKLQPTTSGLNTQELKDLADEAVKLYESNTVHLQTNYPKLKKIELIMNVLGAEQAMCEVHTKL